MSTEALPSDSHEHSAALTRSLEQQPGDQAVAPVTSGIVTIGTTPLDDSHLGTLLQERADSRSLAALAFAVAAYQDSTAEKRRMEARLDRERERSDDLRGSLSSAEKRIAVLEEHVKHVTGAKRLKAFLFGLGGITGGVGLSLAWQAGSAAGPGGALFLLGALIMLVGLPKLRGEE